MLVLRSSHFPFLVKRGRENAANLFKSKIKSLRVLTDRQSLRSLAHLVGIGAAYFQLTFHDPKVSQILTLSNLFLYLSHEGNL